MLMLHNLLQHPVKQILLIVINILYMSVLTCIISKHICILIFNIGT